MSFKLADYKKTVKSVILQSSIAARHVQTLEDGILSSTGPLSSTCHLDYEEEQLKIEFSSASAWNLQKLNINFNDRSLSKQSFESGEASSNGPNNIIHFEFDIADMNISYFSASPKVFLFELQYICGDKSVSNKTTLSLNISTTIYTRHSDWRYKSNLDFFHPSAEIVKFFDNNYEILDDSDEKIKAISVDFEGFRKLKSLQSRFETYGYCKMLNRMLSLEDLTVRKALDELSLKDVHVEETRNPHHFAVFFEGKKLTEKLGFNHLVLTPMDKYNANADSLDDTYKIFNRIIRIVGFRIVFQKPREKKISLDTKYHVQLVENRVPIRLACTALKQMEILKLEPFFTSLDDSALPKQLPKQSVQLFDSFNFRNQEVGSNLSQTAAIKSIVNRSSFPAPYVVFGPPGTGKTSTLVEAITQILTLQPDAKVLVTANSNAACDVIGERLLNFIPRYKMYRMYSPSFDIKFPDRYKLIHPLLKPISNIKTNSHINPSYEEFYSYSVVISTLVSCGRMVTGEVSKTHFDYIFIDECASTIEPYSVIPIVLLGAGEGKLNAQVVLAGDHKQLQGLVHSYFNERHGFAISLMERVMMLEKYQYPYDSNFVTQLIDNFRSHSAILHFSNTRFYHSVLQAKQKKEVADFAIGWELLPNKNFPLIFHSILSPSDMDGTSLYNVEEVHVVASYVNRLLQHGIEGKKVIATDIGIICPYGAQRKRLQERFKFVADLEVGTVDAFQGREKLIIIMSTVRSQTPTVGFLKNEKRLNVAITRAKALLIVIGNGETLQKNKLWYKFINFCFLNNAFVGEKFMLRYRKEREVGQVKKPHPMFSFPRIPLVVPATGISAVDEYDGESDVEYEESDEIFDSDGADSDVSWTHEDFRLKAKTAMQEKPKIVDSLIPKLTIGRANGQSEFTELVGKMESLTIKSEDKKAAHGLNNDISQILASLKTIAREVRSFQDDMNKLRSEI